ncbi:MFS transporter [Sneathia vaginalis]|uniref:MFS transporter n=1 Tax=Sneathia vaginalis TaxID=187101 RepID=UPI00254AF252|nr:MFS transporter [Sneathia vaginalis]MDK9582073.1 MFS transporter [Sneathia vaginalis]
MKTFKYLLMQMFYWACFCAIFSFANPYLSSKGVPVSTIGTILAIASILSVIIQPYLAKLIDTYEFFTVRSSILLSLIVPVFAIILMIISDNPLILYTSYTIALCGFLNVQTFMYPFIFEYMNRGYKVNFGFARGMGSISYAIASYTLGTLSAKYSLNFLPMYFLVLTILVILMILTFEPLGKIKKHEEHLPDVSLRDFYNRNKSFFVVLLAIVLIFFTATAFNNFLRNILVSINYSNYEVGICFTLSSLSEFPVMASIPLLHKKFSYYTLFLVSAVGFSLKAIMLVIGALSGNIYLIYFSQLFQALGFAIYIPVSLFYITDTFETRDVIKAQAYIGTALTLGSILGNYIGAQICQNISIFALLVISTIISMLGTALIVKCAKK